MRTPAHARAPLAAPEDRKLGLVSLVRMAAQTAGGTARRLRRDGDRVEEVLCEVEVDGTRYVLARIAAARPPAAARSSSPVQRDAERKDKPGELERAKVGLSPREREIAVLVAQGLPTKAIAAALAISRWTVCTHLRRIFARVGVGSRAAMVARLLEQGLL